MNFGDYLDKLRSKPESERRKFALVATGISFAVIFLIWVASFSEMNRDAEKNSQAEGAASVADQVEEMRNQMQSNKQSIEDMMQDFPADELGATGDTTEQDSSGTQDALPADEQSQDNPANFPDDAGGNQDTQQNDQQAIPQLP